MGIVRIEDALRVAADADLDLVEVAPNARPPVCKIMDYGKFKYETAQKARESRKNQQQTVVKEQKLRPKIDDHDYETKKGHVIRFLEAGSKVKVTIMFRGREQSRPELGYRLLQRLGADVADYGFVETSAKQDGRNMTMVLAPHRGAKTRAKAAQQASSDEQLARRANSSDEQLREEQTAAMSSLREEQKAPEWPPRPDQSSTELRTDAQIQAAQRHHKAVPSHRNRKNRAPEGESPSPARAQADHSHASAGGPHDGVRQRHQACARPPRRLSLLLARAFETSST